jgi:hypothetical protein
MSLFDTVPATFDDAVQMLARVHGEGMEHPVRIYWIPDPNRQQVRLVEVSNDFPAYGPAVPIALGQSRTFPYSSSVALATEDDWKAIRDGRTPFPEDWNVGDAKQVWPR